MFDETIGKALFFVMRGAAMTVDVVSDLVHKDIIEVEVTDRIEVMPAQVERMSTEKDAGPPVKTIASEFAPPRPLLLAPSGEQEDRA